LVQAVLEELHKMETPQEQQELLAEHHQYLLLVQLVVEEALLDQEVKLGLLLLAVQQEVL
jgi:hypothetical protein